MLLTCNVYSRCQWGNVGMPWMQHATVGNSTGHLTGTPCKDARSCNNVNHEMANSNYSPGAASVRYKSKDSEDIYCRIMNILPLWISNCQARKKYGVRKSERVIYSDDTKKYWEEVMKRTSSISTLSCCLVCVREREGESGWVGIWSTRLPAIRFLLSAGPWEQPSGSSCHGRQMSRGRDGCGWQAAGWCCSCLQETRMVVSKKSSSVSYTWQSRSHARHYLSCHNNQIPHEVRGGRTECVGE